LKAGADRPENDTFKISRETKNVEGFPCERAGY
jgi:hypothetical protein